MVPEHSYEDVLLTIDNVSLTLGGRQILRDVDAQVRDIRRPGRVQGQVVGFLGPSGIGKTQLFRILAGLQTPTSGRVLVETRQIPVVRGLVGVVAQSYPLFEHRSVLGNLLVAARQGGHDRAKSKDKSIALLQRFGLEQHAGAYPAQLSGGQRQRVAIAQQLLCSDHFLLMDEPFSGLDPLMVEQVCQLITEVAAADDLRTIIVVTHDISAAISVSDTLWLMGRDRDKEGKPIPGARLQTTYNLVERGLAWHDSIAMLPEFSECVREVREKFHVL